MVQISGSQTRHFAGKIFVTSGKRWVLLPLGWVEVEVLQRIMIHILQYTEHIFHNKDYLTKNISSTEIEKGSADYNTFNFGDSNRYCKER